MITLLLQVTIILIISTIYATKSALPRTMFLRDGNKIPIISFGTVGKTNLADKSVKPAVIEAIEAGYRQIDTAAVYKNEEYVGEAIADVIKRGIVTREELFITTKIPPYIGTKEGVLPIVQESLRKLKLDYIDLVLIHSPDNLFNAPEHDYLNVWKGLEDIKKLNMTLYIGVSNFNSTHINKILANSDIVPAANEIEVNPTYPSLELVAYCQSLNITVLSYAPFGFMVPRPYSIKEPESSTKETILEKLAKKYGKIPSQIALRYLIDRGTVPIPTSFKSKHIRSNIDVFDFKLTPEEVILINELNEDVKVYYFQSKPLDVFVKYYGFLK